MDYAELPLIRKDRRVVHTIASSQTTVYEGKLGGAVFFIDNTERKRLERLYAVIREVNQLIVQSILEEELLQKICHVLVDRLGLRFVWIGVPDLKEERIKPLYSCGYEEGYLEEVFISTREDLPEGRGPTGRAYRENRIHINPNTYESPMAKPWKDRMLKRGYLSSCAIPLAKGGRVEYLLNLYAEEPYYFEEKTISLLEELKQDLEFALERLEETRKNTIINEALMRSDSWVLITDEKGNITYVNDAVCRLSGYSREELIGKNPRIFRSGYQDRSFYEKLWKTILSGEEFHAVFINRRKNGELIYLESVIYPIELPDGIKRFVQVARDITRETQLARQVEELTFYDYLTGLLSLEGFKGQAKELLKGGVYILALIDLAGLSAVNTSYGFGVGDQVLKEFAIRLGEAFRNKGMVARVAGDEFAVLYRYKEEEDVSEFLELLKKPFEKPFTVGNADISLSFNAGIAIHPQDGEDLDTLNERAVSALMEAKRAGEGEVRFYSSAFQEKLRDILFAKQLVSKAVEEGLFTLYLQPYFKASDLSLAGFEALVRIVDKSGKVYSPGVFIEYLENSPYLRAFEEWLLRTVVELYERIKRTISINISAKSIKDMSFLASFESYCSIYCRNYPIVLEITERVFIENYEQTVAVFKKIKEYEGVLVALDDFGTGYSSLTYLSNLPVDILKIDISFVRQLTESERVRAVVKNIINLATDLGMKTLAEGVETKEQLEMLRAMNCTYLQGFYLGKPVPIEEAIRLYT